jgi:hypothetical protein
MRTFLDVAEHLFATGRAGNRDASFRRVFEAISALQVVHSKSELDLVNLESVFTTFEMAKTLGSFPGKDAWDIDTLIEDLKWLIVSTLQTTIKFPVQGVSLTGHQQTRNFVHRIAEIRAMDPKATTAIITFNYDIVMDVALASHGIDVEYGLSGEKRSDQAIPLLKLHGSINWAQRGGVVQHWPLGEYIRGHRYPFPDGSVVTDMIPIADRMEEKFGKANDTTGSPALPVIVPPSWNKAESHRVISAVWSRAAQELATAQSIFVVGYSLPPTDTFFRQLYALGTAAAAPLKRVWVINPDPECEARFRSMLGPGAKDRFQFFPEEATEAFRLIIEAIRDG